MVSNKQAETVGFSLAKSALKIMPRDTSDVEKFVVDYVTSDKIYKKFMRMHNDHLDYLHVGVRKAIADRRIR